MFHEHLECASMSISPLLAGCFTGFRIHGLFPDLALSDLLVPVFKDDAGKVGILDKYRPIVLVSEPQRASLVLKLLNMALTCVYTVYLKGNWKEVYRQKHISSYVLYRCLQGCRAC